MSQVSADIITNAAGNGPPTAPYGIVSQGGNILVSSANYTSATGDGINTINMSTGNTNRTFTLPTAAGNAGRVWDLLKSDTGTGQVQIVGTINGSSASATVNALNYKGANCRIYSDGTSFYYLKQITESASYTPTFTNVLNMSGFTARLCTFQRIGTVVTVVNGCTASQTHNQVNNFNCTLPVPTADTSAASFSGHGAGSAGGSYLGYYSLQVGGDGTGLIQVSFWSEISVAEASNTYHFTATYSIT